MIRKSFTLRVLVTNFLLLALPLLIYSFIFFQDSYYEAIQDAKKQLREVVSLRNYFLIASEPVKQVFLNELTYLLNLGKEMSDEDYEKLTHELAEIVHASSGYQIYVLGLGNKGAYKILASSQRAAVDTFFESFHELEYVLNTGSGIFIRQLSERDTQTYSPYIFMAQPFVSKKSGQPMGFLMVSSPFSSQLDAVLAKSAQLQNAQFAVLSGDGIVLKASDPSLLGQLFNPLTPERIKEILSSHQLGNLQLAEKPLTVMKEDDPPFFEFIFKGQVQIAYQSYIPELGISVVGYAAKEALFGAAVRHFLLIYTIYGLILVAGGGVTYWIALWISRPLRQLTHVMGEVSQGNLDVRFKEAPMGFEINILGGIFNHTLETLFHNIQRAEDERVQKETYQRELAIARNVQRSLLPGRIPEIKGAAVAGIYLPASDVGGDFYAFLTKQTQEGEDVVAIAVADAAGGGISSCLYSLSARSLVCSYTTLYNDVGQILNMTNKAFIRDTGDTGMFVTMIFGMYHTVSKTFSYYSCGHVPGILLQADGQMASLNHSGIALGLKEWPPTTPHSIQLKQGDVIVLFTDGLVEAVNQQHQQFSDERLKAILQSKKWQSAQEVVDSISGELRTFTEGASQEEEVIIVALKVD